ncbi:hypothetical protein LUZ61_006149 [Rhynchospora tenuis]|uniref:TF-B3 domain-containing protein n=1 Tax=Rhynchospora tenuis TaxID=198213 RepID=A0AAD6EVD8_9POAL|nr:hypothetical protein LUZ61_006149 [Rhynchospora tenuis]
MENSLGPLQPPWHHLLDLLHYINEAQEPQHLLRNGSELLKRVGSDEASADAEEVVVEHGARRSVVEHDAEAELGGLDSAEMTQGEVRPISRASVGAQSYGDLIDEGQSLVSGGWSSELALVACSSTSDLEREEKRDRKELWERWFRSEIRDFPKAFQKNFKGRIAKSVELKGPSGNIWQVGVAKLVESLTFQSGWNDFVIANNIKANDLLVFKYNRDQSAFEVQIFDPTGCERSSSFFVKEEKIYMHERSDSSIKILDGHCKMQQDETVTITSSSSGDSEYHANFVPIQKPRGRASKEAGASKDPNDGGEFEYSSDEPIVLPKFLSMTPGQTRRAIQLSHGVKPGIKYFVTLMKFSHVHGTRLGVPTKFASENLPRENKEAILHYKGNKWPLSIYYNSGLYPYFSSGWKKFARDNNLQIGDLCLFELMKNKDTASLKVHLSRN